MLVNLQTIVCTILAITPQHASTTWYIINSVANIINAILTYDQLVIVRIAKSDHKRWLFSQ